MLRITRHISRFGQRMLIYLVENVSMFQYIVVFILVVIGFGVLYTICTPKGHGIGHNLKPLSDATFLTGIYFSVVTISSLGYGHMHPMGFSKALACLEVLFGLAAIGIMIAKVTSQRLSYHVSRLFASDAQKRLEEIAEKFKASEANLKAIMPKLVGAYQSTPGQATQPTENKSELISAFRRIIGDLNSECVKLRDYFSSEIEQGKYFQSVPVTAVTQVGNAVDEPFWILGQLIKALPPQSMLEIFDLYNRKAVSEAISSQKKVCDLVNNYATEQGTRDAFQRIKEHCDGIPTSYFAVPESQPDQAPQDTDDPQGLTGMGNQQTDIS